LSSKTVSLCPPAQGIRSCLLPRPGKRRGAYPNSSDSSMVREEWHAMILYKGIVATGTFLVQGVGKQLLTRPCRSCDQNRRIALGVVSYQFLGSDDRRTLSVDVRKRVLSRKALSIFSLQRSTFFSSCTILCATCMSSLASPKRDWEIAPITVPSGVFTGKRFTTIIRIPVLVGSSHCRPSRPARTP